jgi:hypothetical protein
VNDGADLGGGGDQDEVLRLDEQQQRDDEKSRGPEADLALSAAPAPALIAPMMAVVLRPPMADTNTSRPSEPSISRRTSWRKDIRLRRPFDSSRMPIAVTGLARKHLAAPCAAQQFSLPRQFGAASHLSAA